MICVDLTKLNANIKREVHPLPSVDYSLGKVGSSRIFRKLDANSAFLQRKLSLPSSLLGGDIALKDCPMESLLAQKIAKKSWKAI